MRRLVIAGVIVVVVLAIVASMAGALSFGHDRYRSYVTPRGEAVRVQEAGIYRFSIQPLVVSGIPWDFVRLVFVVPLLVVALVLYARGSLRGAMLLIGVLVSLSYQYLLWTFDWAYNSLFLVYVALYSLSLCTTILILAQVDLAAIRRAVTARFPSKTAAAFSFALGGLLLFKVLGEIVPSIGSGAMPAAGRGYYTMVDQGLDMGLLVPFCIAIGVLLLNRHALGYLLSASSLIVFLSIGLPVVAGEVMLGLSTGHMNVGGIAVFTALMAAGLFLLVRILSAVQRPGAMEDGQRLLAG